MSNECLVVELAYYDAKSRITGRKQRDGAQISLRRMPNSYSEVRITCKKNLDIFVTNSIVLPNSKADKCSTMLWIPNYKCMLTVSGSEAQISQIQEFVQNCGNTINKENTSPRRTPLKGTPEKQPIGHGKRGFGVVARDLFRSGLTPEGKMLATAHSKHHTTGVSPNNNASTARGIRGSPPAKSQSRFMGLLTAATTVSASRSQAQGLRPESAALKIAHDLTAEQQQVLEACLQGRNVFYTGGAGTGKSTLLTVIIDRLIELHGPRGVYVTATTGLAACAVGGSTVHQFAGISARLEEHGTAAELKAQHDRVVSQACSKAGVLKRLREAKVLLVDEVSMLSPTLLEMVDAIAQRARGIKKPMGGLQVVFCGDFFQLPPVASTITPIGGGVGSKAASSSRRFCFQSPIWSSLIEASFDLTVVYRQGDDHDFIAALNAVRRGELPPCCLDAFQPCVGRKLGCEDGILPTQIFTHKRDVDQLNTIKLKELPGAAVVFEASDSGDEAYLRMIRSHCPARQRLELKVGAQVILVKTTAMAEGLVNGARGIVMRFARESNHPVVKFADGVERVLGSELFSVSLGGIVVAQRSQLPLDLSWGISVHKAQGMTVDKAQLHLKNVFECGQAYVALSRVRSLAGLSLSHPLQAGQVRAHPEVVKFYEKLATTR